MTKDNRPEFRGGRFDFDDVSAVDKNRFFAGAENVRATETADGFVFYHLDCRSIFDVFAFYLFLERLS